MNTRSRLSWQCRRGMKELDLLLGGFLERHFDTASDAEQADFERLLSHSDEDIMDWVMDRVTPPDPGLAQLVRALRGDGRE